MYPDDYARFTDTLVNTLSIDDRVLGLVAAGSMAAISRQPDQWSDHDFWIITRPGEEDYFRASQAWLPDANRIVLAFQETEHGVKIVYDDGHLVEFAVFGVTELHVARANDYRILLDREHIAHRLQDIHIATIEWSEQNTRDGDFLYGQFLTNLQVGIGRFHRGERLSAQRFIKVRAVDHLLPLLVRYGVSYEAARSLEPLLEQLDNLDPTRRFESAFPAIGAELNRLLLLDTPQAAAGLLALAHDILRDCLPDYPHEAVATIRHYIGAEAVSG